MKNFLSCLVLATTVGLTTASTQAEPDAAAEAMFKNLMTATVSNDYDGFLADCDAAMKAALTKPKLEAVSKQIEARASQGYDSQYFGSYQQHGYEVHLWRLRFKDHGDDILATLSVKDGKVGGFYLR